MLPTHARRHFSMHKFSNIIRHSIFMLISLTLMTCTLVAQDEKQLTSLEPDKPIERDLTGGQSHSYRIVLKPGQFLRAIAEQRGIDVVLSLYSPDGKKLMEVDSPNGKEEPESMSFEAVADGTFRLEVKSLEANAPQGRYEIRIDPIHKATSQNRTRIAAEKSFAEAQRLKAQNTPDALRGAIAKYEEARKQWHEIGDRYWQALAIDMVFGLYLELNEQKELVAYLEQIRNMWHAAGEHNEEFKVLKSLGFQWFELKDYVKAIDYLKQSLSLRQAANLPIDTLPQVFTYIGRSYIYLGDNQATLKTLNDELALFHGAGNRGLQAWALYEIAKFYALEGQYKLELDSYNQALQLWREIGDRAGEAKALSGIGGTYYRLGDMKSALEFSNQAVAVFRILGDRQQEADALANIGNVLMATGEMQKSLETSQQALELARAVGDRLTEAALLLNIGSTYKDLGDDQKALAFLNQALPIWPEINNPSGEAFTRGTLGAVYMSLGDAQKALAFITQSATLFSQIGNHTSEAMAFQNLGVIYGDLGERQKAIEYLNKALPILQAEGDRSGEATILGNLGTNYDELGQTQKGMDFYKQALALHRAIGNRDGEARTLYNIANSETDIYKKKQEIEEALAIVETLRTKIASKDLRSSYFATVQIYYKFYIALLMELHKQHPNEGHDGAALQASERARARSLLETLAEAKADIREGVDTKLVERERVLQQRLNTKAQEQMKLPGGPATEAEANAIAQEIEALTTEFQQVEAEIRQKSKKYAALTQPQPLTLKEIQSQVLDSDTLLLEYSLGEFVSYLWVVTPAGITSYRLPKQAEIETTAKRVYASLNARNQHVKNETKSQRDARVAQADSDFQPAALALSKLVLTPMAAQLGKKRLVIVADGMLQFIPFAALPAPEAQGSGVGDQGSGKENRNRPLSPDFRNPLIVDHEIVSLPSASTLAVIRREINGRKPASKSVVVLADPVFMKKDVRVKKAPNSENSVDMDVTTNAKAETVRELQLVEAADDTGVSIEGLTVPRLPGSRKEAEEIVAMVPASERKVALDFDANRAMATSAELGQYRYVHFSTHGFLNSVHPELSGIVFSLVNERGEAQDGFLRAHEIFNLKLPAELVVLSACQTGIGKEVKGEGLVSLTRGFMYAGAPRVVVSLWSVSEMGTTELMVRFYREMLKKGKRPAEALRAAQLSLMKEKRWASPFYWAPFTLQGEWR